MSTLDTSLAAVSDALKSAGVDGLLIGGLAVNHYGYTRATLDIDFMIAIEDRDEICRAMQKAGFTNIERLENVVFYQKPDDPIRIDILEVDFATMQELVKRSVEIKGQPYCFRLPCLEDLLRMKLFALKNGWERRVHKDLPDIANLVHVNGVDLEKTLRPMCLQFADDQVYEKIAAEVGILQKS